MLVGFIPVGLSLTTCTRKGVPLKFSVSRVVEGQHRDRQYRNSTISSKMYLGLPIQSTRHQSMKVLSYTNQQSGSRVGLVLFHSVDQPLHCRDETREEFP